VARPARVLRGAGGQGWREWPARARAGAAWAGTAACRRWRRALGGGGTRRLAGGVRGRAGVRADGGLARYIYLALPRHGSGRGSAAPRSVARQSPAPSAVSGPGRRNVSPLPRHHTWRGTGF